MDYLKTGRLITKKRKAHDFTLDELSILLGVSPQEISLWEKHTEISGSFIADYAFQGSWAESD